MLRVCDNPEEISGPGILGVDQRRKQVTLIDPGGMSGAPNGITSEERRVGFAPKMFAFDGIFDQTDDQVSFFFFFILLHHHLVSFFPKTLCLVLAIFNAY